jgi:hypothetical protein
MTTIPETPARRLWPGQRPPRVEHPAPEVTNRPATAEEIPRGARTVQTVAERHGWMVAVTYARGTKPGRSATVVDSIALRFRRGEVRAWAVWLDGKFDEARLLYPGELPLPMTVSALCGQLSLPMDGAS